MREATACNAIAGKRSSSIRRPAAGFHEKEFPAYAMEVLMTAPHWTFSFSESFWETLALLGCLAMVAFEAVMMWLLVPK
jgi:hypothetical protein